MPRVDSGRVRGKAGQLLPLPTAHTQSHLRIDGYYLDGLDKGARGLSIESEVPFPRLSDPAVAQRATDAGLVRYCDGLTEKALEEVVNSNVVSNPQVELTAKQRVLSVGVTRTSKTEMSSGYLV